MNGPDIIASIASDIERQLQHHEPQALAPIPATISPWLAAALLQKAIRRGRTHFALGAAATLLSKAPDRLWRRLAVIAVEDVGLGDLDAVFLTIVAAGQRRRLARLYGMERLVSFIVSRLTISRKCRATDDLYVVTNDCPSWNGDRLELTDMPLNDLLDVIAGPDPIERRGIAVRHAMGGGEWAEDIRLTRRRRPQAVFDFLCEAGFPQTLVEICREAHRQTGEAICGFLPLLWSVFDRSETVVRSDEFPSEVTIAGVPSWALDKFTRQGRTAMARFLARDSGTSRWLDSHVAKRDRGAVFGHALFRAESGLVKDRAVWPDGLSLRRQADWNSFAALEPVEAVELLHLVRADIGLLNEERAHVL
ncbi:hypothetical protein [Mesorhizobium salmacidum]|uniref:Uncharacterized protein n=1 Tax=Mesorhizobium salmacidum TaxID=3015171 RepID=A0ABU8KUQ3_9HYPH